MPDAPAAGSGPLLRVRDLKTHFRTERGVVRAVDGVSFDLEQGQTLGIVGESGCGKTVLSRSVMGLLAGPAVVQSGEVSFDGRNLVGLDVDQLRQLWGVQIAMVFQDPMTSLNPVLQVGQQITEGLRLRLRMDRRQARQTALDLLRSVGIPEPERRIRQYPQQLSGGMRQRVMVAIAIACGPRLLLADEPTTALDVTIQAQILDLLQEQQQRRQMAMILVTHDLGVAAGRTDQIAVMYAGKIVELAPTRLLFRNTRMPYTEALIRSIPLTSNSSHTRLQAIGGLPPSLSSPPGGCRFAARCPYARPRCAQEEPPLTETAGGHYFACWYPVGSPDGPAGGDRETAAAATGGED